MAAAAETIAPVNLGLATVDEKNIGFSHLVPSKSAHRKSRGGEDSEGVYTTESDDGPYAGGAAAGGADVTDPDKDEDGPVPDGGWEAWLCIVGAWCVNFVGYGWINSIGIFQEYYQNGPLRDYSPSQISWITSLEIFFISAVGPFAGQIYDRYGLTWLVRIGSVMHVLGLMMASLSTKYYQFLLSQGVCSSIGVAMAFVCAVSMISDWFDKRRGLAFGVVATGSSLGGVIFPIMMSHLFRTIGYPWAMRSAAFMILALLVVANLTLKTRTPRRPVKLTRESVVKPFFELPFILLLVGLTLMPFGMYVPVTYIPVAALGQGYVDQPMASNLISLYNATSFIGRLMSGWLSDRFGKYNIYILSGYLSGTVVLALWIPAGSEAAVIVFSLLFGLCSGAYISLMGALVPCISPIKEIGYRNGITFLFSAFGGLVTSPIAGLILDTHAGWTGLKIFAGAFLFGGTTGVVLARISVTGFKLKVSF